MTNSKFWLALLLMVPLVVVAFLTFRFWPEGEEQLVTVMEERTPTAVAPLTEALDQVEARVGFRPAVPDRIPVKGLRLFQIDSFLTEAAGAVIRGTIVLFAESGSEPRLVRVFESRGSPADVPEDARSLGKVDGFEIWAVTDPFPRFLIVGGDISVSIQVVTRPHIDDGEALPMIRSIISQLR